MHVISDESNGAERELGGLEGVDGGDVCAYVCIPRMQSDCVLVVLINCERQKPTASRQVSSLPRSVRAARRRGWHRRGGVASILLSTVTRTMKGGGRPEGQVKW